ncbi:translesion DNA synthesis-associated protein ImuA [Paraburkholderia terrae]
MTRSGVGELRLLLPALAVLAPRPIALLQPPQQPDGLGLAYIGLGLERIMLVRGTTSADALWSSEQILRAGTCGALIFWAQHVQAPSLRRLHLAAQSEDTLFVMVRPVATAQDASAAVLRVGLRPSADGLVADVIKRRGPAAGGPVSVLLQPTPVLLSTRRSVSRLPLAETVLVPGGIEHAHA